MVVAGSIRSAALDAQGGLWHWSTTLSSSECTPQHLPQRVKGLPPIFNAAYGLNFLVAEAGDGSLWMLGNYTMKQPGLCNTNSTLHPTLVQERKWAEGPLRCLAAFQDGFILIDSQGAVFSAGENDSEKLGRSPSHEEDFELQRIENIPPMLQASCGMSLTLSLDENGRVWSWGLNRNGELGEGFLVVSPPFESVQLERVIAVVAGSYHSLVFSENEICWPSDPTSLDSSDSAPLIPTFGHPQSLL